MVMVGSGGHGRSDRAPTTTAPGRGRNDPGQYVELADEWWRPDGAFAGLHWLATARARLVPPAARPGAVLVDLGCGGGLLAAPLRGRGYHMIGVDPVHTSLRIAAGHGTGAVGGDAYRVPLRSGCADVVVAGELLEHVDDPARVVAEAARLLRPGGLLVGDTIADTRAARLILVTVGEHVRNLVPAGIHDPALFVSPDRLIDACRSNGLHPEVRGLRPAVGDLLRYLATGRGPVAMLPAPSTALMYQFRAVRHG